MKPSLIIPVIILAALLLFTLSQYSFSQPKLIQTLVEENISGSSQLGFAVSSAGDLNNDGYDDIIVGAPYYNSGTGRAYIYYGGGTIETKPGIIVQGEKINNSFGVSVSCAGDVNNDGYSDVIVGAPYYNSNTGRAYIYYGGSDMDSTADVTLTGKGTNNSFGYSVSSAGHVNKTVYDAVIVGAPRYNTYTGRAYIYYGGSSMDSTTDVTLTGQMTNSYFGSSVSAAGDVDKDSCDDVIVGAYGYNTWGDGRIYIYHGGESMDSTADVIIGGESTTGSAFGFSVANAGDVNKDGYDDVIIGAPYYPLTGLTYIYYGGTSMGGGSRLILQSPGMNNYFGYSVSGAGDVNNDGYDDVVVGAPEYDSYRGRAYIFYGGDPMNTTFDIAASGEGTNNYFSSSVSGAGDVNNDGYDDVIIGAYNYNQGTGRTYICFGGSSMDSTADALLDGEGTINNFGFSISNAGDVNNDGYDDLIVGAIGYNNALGCAYIYYGGNPMNGTPDVTIQGTYGTDYHFGYSVSGAGDVNNDGYDDVVVGEPEYSALRGRTYVYYGGNPMDNMPDVIMQGEATDNYFGNSVSGAGDVNNDGYADIIIGAPAYNGYTGRAYIYYGGNPMNAAADLIMNGEGTNQGFGYSVSGAGNVDNDDFYDVIVGASGFDSNRGRVYIYHGGDPMDSTADVKLSGQDVYNDFGASVSGAGDVNNDGYDDVIVGAYNCNSSAGCAYIYYGGGSMDSTADVIMAGEVSNNYFGFSVSGAGNVNNDSYDDVIVGAYNYNQGIGRAYIYYGGSSMDSTADIIMTGEGTDNYFGYSVSGAGDVNNDGYDDFMAGAYQYPVNGKLYLYSDPSSPVSVKTDFTLNPDRFELLQNYPNPFNPSTTIEFSIATYGHTSLRIFDILGREVATLLNEAKPAGSYRVVWNAVDLPSGIYFSSLENGGKKLTRKLLLLK